MAAWPFARELQPSIFLSAGKYYFTVTTVYQKMPKPTPAPKNLCSYSKKHMKSGEGKDYDIQAKYSV